jgi:hypothetical protein
MDLYNFNSLNLLNWIVAFAIFEIPIAIFYYKISKPNDTVRNWYSGKNINIWNILIQDSLYVICGIIISLRLFKYLVIHNFVPQLFYIFIFCFIFVQIVGDILFSIIIKNWPLKYSNYWILYFKNYIKKSGFNALFGDTLYIIVWSITYYLVSKYINDFDIKFFIISLFIFIVSAYSIKHSINN